MSNIEGIVLTPLSLETKIGEEYARRSEGRSNIWTISGSPERINALMTVSPMPGARDRTGKGLIIELLYGAVVADCVDCQSGREGYLV